MIILNSQSINIPTSAATRAPASDCMCAPPLSSMRSDGEQIGYKAA